MLNQADINVSVGEIKKKQENSDKEGESWAWMYDLANEM